MKNFKEQWKILANTKNIQAYHIVQRAILIAMNSKSENKQDLLHVLLLKAFTPITSNNKLSSGSTRYGAVKSAAFLALRKVMTRDLRFQDLLGVKSDDILETPEEYTLYEQLASSINIDKMDRYYTYIFVRTDLSQEQQVVQAAHVAMVAGSKLSKKKLLPPAHNIHFTVCGVENEKAIFETLKMLGANGFKYDIFREPDIGNQITAIATNPIRWDKRTPLLGIPLLTYKK